MTEKTLQVVNTPNGPQVYLSNIRIHHWQAGAVSATIGLLGLLLDDKSKNRNFYTALTLAGTMAFVDDLPDFLNFVDSLRKQTELR